MLLSFKDIYNENIAYNKVGYMAFRVDKDILENLKSKYVKGQIIYFNQFFLLTTDPKDLEKFGVNVIFSFNLSTDYFYLY